ncbi:MAG: DoxX family protein [Gemmatimonadaceae bacterium]
MTIAYHGSMALSALVFLYYGCTCLFANGMAADFERFGMTHLRTLTGSLELLGAVGLIMGQFIPGLVFVSAGGLTLLMALGLATRIRVRDPVREAAPAALLMGINAFVAWNAPLPLDGLWMR